MLCGKYIPHDLKILVYADSLYEEFNKGETRLARESLAANP
jgi:hypothetical protein